MDSGIYVITNTQNRKRYIGSSNSISARWRRHRSDLRLKHHVNKHLQASWNKYGEKAFVFEVLEYVENREDLLAKEQVFLDWLPVTNPLYGYNNDPVAGSPKKRKCSEATKKKLSLAQQGRFFSIETRQRISAGLLGRKHSEATKKKIGLASAKRKHTKASKEKMSRSHIGKKFRRQHVKRYRKP